MSPGSRIRIFKPPIPRKSRTVNDVVKKDSANTREESLKVLETVANFRSVPVPFIKEVIGVALKVLQACKDATVVGEGIQKLQNQVIKLMIAIVNTLTASNGDVNEAVAIKIPKEMGKEVADLQSTLEGIIDDLSEIKAQNRWLVVFFRNFNKSKVDICVDRLTSALQRCNVLNEPRVSKVLQDNVGGTMVAGDRVEISGGTFIQNNCTEEVDDLHKKVDDKFDRILSNLSGSKALTASRGSGRQSMPGKPRVFYGRDQLVKEFAQLLCEEPTSRVCVLGPGGMGKTSLALAVIESPLVQAKYAARCFWVPCVEATSPAVFLQLLYVHLQISRSTNDILEDILAELNTSDEPRLILLDNFETPWIPVEGPRHQVNNVLRRLGQISHVALLVTMRGAEPPCDDIIWQSKNIEPVGKEAARSIFHDIYPISKHDYDVDELLAALGYLPFAVTLMAKLGKKSRSSARALLDEWSQVGTEMISHSSTREDNMNRSISLSIDRDFVQEDPDALLLLSTLSLLPAGTLRANLRWWAPNLKAIASAVATLSDAALLLTKEDSTEKLFVLPVIQSFMSTNNRIPNNVRQQVQHACCQYVSDHACRYYNPLFKHHSQALATEDTNIQSIMLTLEPDVSSIPLDKVVETLLHFTWYRVDTCPSIEIAQRTLELAELSEKDQYIAEGLSALGDTHGMLDRRKVAEKYLEKGYRYSDKLTVDRRIVVECGLLLVDVRYLLGHPVEHTISFVRNLQSQFGATLGDFQRAKITSVLGVSLKHARQYSKALKTLHKAIEMFKLIEDFPDVAHSMLYIAQIYRRTSRLTEALDTISKANDIMEHLDNRAIYSRINRTYGNILVDLNRHTEAIPKFEKALLIDQGIGRILGVAYNLQNLGYVYVCRGDYQGALVAYVAAMEKVQESGQDASKPQIHRCRKNLDLIKRKIDDETMDISMLIERPKAK